MPLVGREDELRLLHRLVEQDGTTACLVLSGEPGIGKTTLWEAGVDLARERGLQVLSARTSEAEASLSFAVLADLVEGIDDDDLESLPAPQLRALEVTLRRADPVGGPPDPYAISAAFLNVLGAVRRRAPLLIAIDDLQWLDPPSTGPLLFAARRLARGQARFLVTRRPGRRSELERVLLPAGVEHAEVAPMSIGAIGRVLSDKLGFTLSRRTLRRVHDGSQGNPLFALELGRLIGEMGALDAGGELPLPDFGGDVFSARIQHADEPVRRVLLALALSGGLSQAELARMVDPLSIEDALSGGLVVVERSRVRPANPILAAAARKAASAQERRALHHDLAAAVTDPIQKARHLAIGTAGTDRDAAAAAAAAADLAASSGRISEAVALGEHALRLSPPADAESSERVLSLAGFHSTAGQIRQMTDLLTARMHELPPGRHRALAHLLLCHQTGGEVDEEHLERALAEAGHDPEVRALAFSMRALKRALQSVDRLDEAESFARMAVSAAQLAGPAVEQRVAVTLAWTRVLRGRSIEDLRRAGSTSPWGMSIDEASIDRPIGVRLAFRGQIEQAKAVFERLLSLADERGELRSLGSIQLQLCEVALRAGHLGEVRRLLEDFEEVLLAAQLRQEWRRSFLGRLHALMEAVAGNPAETARWAADVFADEETPDNPGCPGWDRLETERALGIAALFDHDAERAVEHLRTVWEHTRREHIDDPGAFPAAGDLVEALVESDRIDDAAEVIEELRRLSLDQAHPWGLATVERGESLVTLALAGQYPDAAADGLVHAAATFGELGLDFDRARSLLCLGAVQRRFKKRAAARSSLERAAAIFERCGSVGWARRANDELSRVSGRRSAPGDALTPTEGRVVNLAANGMSNKEIARQLFVSVNTVEGHLSRAYAKLGVSSRGQLVRVLRTFAEE